MSYAEEFDKKLSDHVITIHRAKAVALQNLVDIVLEQDIKTQRDIVDRARAMIEFNFKQIKKEQGGNDE